MKTSRFSINGINKGKLLAAALPIGLALAPHPVLAHNFTLGSNRGDVVLDDFPSWSVLNSVSFNIPAGQPSHQCAATAGADAANPRGNGSNQRYNFVLTLDNSNPPVNTDSERTIEMRNQGGVDDPDRWPVTTNQTFTVGVGGHTIFFLGREENPNNPNMTSEDSNLSVVCTHDSP
jgi:hypothetical protein